MIHSGIEKWRWWFCIVFFIVIMIKNSTEVAMLAANSLNNIQLKSVFCTINALASTLINPLLSCYILRCCNNNVRKAFLWKFMLVLWGASVISIIAGVITNFFCPVPGGDIRITDYYMLLIYLGISVIGLITNIIAAIRRRKQLSRIRFIVILCYLLLPVSAMLMMMEIMLLWYS